MPLLMALFDEQKSLTNDAPELFFYSLQSGCNFQDSPFAITDAHLCHHGISLHLIFSVISPQFMTSFPRKMPRITPSYHETINFANRSIAAAPEHLP